MKISQPKKSHKKLIIAIVSVLLLAGIGTATFFILNKDNSSSNKETNTEVATNTDVASNTDVALNDTTETTETVEETTETVTTETVEEEPSEEPSVETPSENTTTETETPSENKPSETPSTPSTTETPSVPSEPTHNEPTTSEPTTTETTTETPSEPTPNVEKHWCGTPMQMMSGYIFHPAEGYYATYILFSNGEEMPYDYNNGDWVGDYMFDNGITSFTISENHWVETTPEWREENVTQMCCPSCRYADNGFVAY